MQRICRVCQQSKNTPYKDICRNCYQKQWATTIPEKTCEKCGKTFRTVGNICVPCNQNERNRKTRSIPCSRCQRIGLIIINIAEALCTKCDRLKRETDQPGRADKRRDYLMKYSRKKKGTDLNAPKRVSTGRWKTATGYVMIYKPDHPNSKSTGCINEHTFVMSEKLGRPLTKNENVHHRNGVRDDNRIENLELWHRGQCPGQRLQEKLEWCKHFLLEYGYSVTDPRGIIWEVTNPEVTA